MRRSTPTAAHSVGTSTPAANTTVLDAKVASYGCRIVLHGLSKRGSRVTTVCLWFGADIPCNREFTAI